MLKTYIMTVTLAFLKFNCRSDTRLFFLL